MLLLLTLTHGGLFPHKFSDFFCVSSFSFEFICGNVLKRRFKVRSSTEVLCLLLLGIWEHCQPRTLLYSFFCYHRGIINPGSKPIWLKTVSFLFFFSYSSRDKAETETYPTHSSKKSGFFPGSSAEQTLENQRYERFSNSSFYFPWGSGLAFCYQNE